MQYVATANCFLLQVKPLKCIVLSIFTTLEKVPVNPVDITHVQHMVGSSCLVDVNYLFM